MPWNPGDNDQAQGKDRSSSEEQKLSQSVLIFVLNHPNDEPPQDNSSTFYSIELPSWFSSQADTINQPSHPQPVKDQATENSSQETSQSQQTKVHGVYS